MNIKNRYHELHAWIGVLCGGWPALGFLGSAADSMHCQNDQFDNHSVDAHHRRWDSELCDTGDVGFLHAYPGCDHRRALDPRVCRKSEKRCAVVRAPGLAWAVKDSLVTYVEALDDGVVEAVALASRGEAGFEFPEGVAASTYDPDGSSGAWQFRGAVRLTGHWGMLDIELRDPRIELTGRTGVLLVAERGGTPSQKYLPLADLEIGEPVEAADGSVSLEATASLTGHGCVLLGGQYEAGAALSPVFLTFPSRHD
ncbi:HtaA domain-containing protein [Kocuria sp. CPCC 205292]|uniref:HtaA domain-containing protein n=1 Tax=Kocuria cellulosilytica TaxID=3071451 RepID=UPI0034D6976F